MLLLFSGMVLISSESKAETPTRGTLQGHSESYTRSFSKPTFYGSTDPNNNNAKVEANGWDDIAMVVIIQDKHQVTTKENQGTQTSTAKCSDIYQALYVPLNGTTVNSGTSQTVIVEDFTATWCSWCTGVVGAMNRLDLDSSYFPDKYIGIAWHSQGGTYGVGTPGSSASSRASHYAIGGGIPRYIIDGMDPWVGGALSPNDTAIENRLKNSISTRGASASPLSIEAEADHDDTSAWVNFTVTVEGSSFDNILVDATVVMMQDAYPRRHGYDPDAYLGWIGQDYTSFRIFDIEGTPPTITDISPAADSVISGVQEITFTASDVDAADDKIAKKVEIREAGGNWNTLAKTDDKYIWDTTQKTAGIYIYKDGDYEIRITATDYWDETTTVTVPVILMNPDPPYLLFDDARMQSEIGTSMVVQGTMNIYWEATDDEDDDNDLLVDLFYGRSGEPWVLIAEDLPNIGVYAWDTLNPERIPDNDRYRINAVVTDGESMEDEGSTNFEFAINNLDPPVITIDSPKEGQELTETGTIRWSASDDEDPNGDLLIDIELSSDGGENYLTLVNGAQNTGAYHFDTTYLEDGENYVAKVTVKDLSGTKVSAISQVFTIYNNDPPVCQFISPEDEDTITGEVEIIWYSADEEDEIGDLKYELYFMHSSGSTWEPLAVNEQNTGSFMLDTTELPNGDGIYHLKLVVKDSRGELSGAQTIYVTVYNPDEPEITSPAGPTAPVSGGTAKFAWIASDPDPGETEYLKVWVYVSEDGTQWTPVAEGIDNTGSYDLDVRDLDDGTWQVKIVISDGSEENLTAEHIFTGIVVNNPDAPTVRFTTAPATDSNVTGDISFAWNGEDLDGDDISYEIQYRMSGDETWMPIQDASGLTDTVFVWNTSKLDTGHYEVRIIATDSSSKMLTGEQIIGPFQIWVEKEEDPDGGHSVIDDIDDTPSDDESDNTGLFIVIGIVVVVIMLIIVVVLVFLVIKRRQKDNEAFYNAPPGGLPMTQAPGLPPEQRSELPPAGGTAVTQGMLPQTQNTAEQPGLPPAAPETPQSPQAPPAAPPVQPPAAPPAQSPQAPPAVPPQG
ncbi:MAG: hypothetical protein ACMUIG_06945 [Thermoplasmatota archaeon]